MQYHTHREEFWHILSGHPEIVAGEMTTHNPEPGDEFDIKPNEKHRISAPVDDVLVLEVSLGVFDEDDIVRLEDKYGRVT